MVTVLARTQPAAALQLMEASPTLKMQHLYRVMGQMALQDPHAVMALAEQLPKGKDGDRAAGAAMWVLARDDPAAALGWAQGLTDPDRKRTALSNAFAAWAGVAPEAAQQQALALAGEERDAAMSAIVRMTVEKDPDQALRMASQITSPKARDSALGFLTRGLLDAVPPQPERAATAIEAMSPGEHRDSVTRWIAGTWASTDLDGARRWVISLPPGEGRREAIHSVVNEWGEKDSREAMSWYLKNEPPTGDSSGVEHLLGQWIARDETEALGYLRGLPNGRTKDMLLSEAIESAATREAPHAAQLLTTVLSADAQRLAAAGVAKSWAERDPAAAANWAMTLSEPQASARACEVIAAAWARRDFVKTTAWLDGLPAGEARDAAIASFTQVASGIDAQGALAWAGAVADPAQRDTVTEKLLQSWITRDAVAARQWLQASESVSPAVRTRMLAFRP